MSGFIRHRSTLLTIGGIALSLYVGCKIGGQSDSRVGIISEAALFVIIAGIGLWCVMNDDQPDERRKLAQAIHAQAEQLLEEGYTKLIPDEDDSHTKYLLLHRQGGDAVVITRVEWRRDDTVRRYIVWPSGLVRREVEAFTWRDRWWCYRPLSAYRLKYIVEVLAYRYAPRCNISRRMS